MDTALAIEHILPAAQYNGSVTANTLDAWEKVMWQDERIPKPTWEELESSWAEVAEQSAIARRIAAIDARLAGLDLESTRPLRALLADNGTIEDKERLEALESEAAALRVERAQLAG